jgi:MFS family permease
MPNNRILPTIVIAQFFCTSLWFAGNAIMPDIVKAFDVEPSYLSQLASIVQVGFITGTLVFAILNISDRFASSKVFFVCALIAALINVAICIDGISLTELMTFRFMTGFFLAGIYPVGMKIASDYYQQGLGRSLGFLVGALVLGTAFPHMLKSISGNLPWKYVLVSTSTLCFVGGLSMWLLVPNRNVQKNVQRLKWNAWSQGFRNKQFRAAAFGYFGHMWELYAFWVFVPVILTAYEHHYPGTHFNVPLLSFFIIAAGCLSCIGSGLISQRAGAARTATAALLISCVCCLVSPFLLFTSSSILLIVFLFIWSMAVIADSPLFSTLVAQHAPAESRGTSLTIVTCIGFAITIISIQLIALLRNSINEQYIYLVLALGPVLGLVILIDNLRIGRRDVQ